MIDLNSRSPDTTSSRLEEDAVDAVFVIGTGSSNGNEELRYALRDLARFCPFVRRVYICGECPPWVDTTVVKHLKWPDRFNHAKDANIIDKLRHACEQPGIAKKILFCSDDQFVTRECTWEDFAPRWLRKYIPADTWYEARKRVWHTRLRKTLDRERKRRLEKGLDPASVFYYQPHMWMQIDRDLFVEYAKWSGYETRDDTIIASGYFNFADVAGKANYDHEFIAATHKGPLKTTHVAYSDNSFQAAMKYLRETFRDRCIFERNTDGNMKDMVEKILGDGAKQGIVRRVTREDLLRIDKNDPTMVVLSKDIAIAEDLRARNAEGWETVWDDIVDRWSRTTENGKLYVPVTMSFSAKAMDVIRKATAASASHASSVSSASSASAAATPEAGDHKCSACEAKRKALAMAKNSVPERRDVIRNAPVMYMNSESEVCVECAVDHLSTAIAYLNSNAARPDALDTILAKGEVQVAMHSLFTSKYLMEYNKCAAALESANSANSMFSAAYLLDVLKRIVDKAH